MLVVQAKTALCVTVFIMLTVYFVQAHVQDSRCPVVIFLALFSSYTTIYTGTCTVVV